MSRESCRAVGICGSSSGKKDSRSLFASAVRLAFHVDDSDDGPVDRVLSVLDDFTNARGESKSLFQSYFPMPGTGKACVGICNNAEESRAIVAERCISRQHGFRFSGHGGR